MLFRTSYRIERVIIQGFLLVILVGAFLLYLSNKYIYNIPISPVDSLFLATSGVCVTGLTTVNVATELGFLSQIILLMLVQLGGLGFMTGMMFLAMAVGKRIGVRNRMSFLSGLGVEGLQGAVKLFRIIIYYTLFIELTGALFLFWGFRLHGDPYLNSIYYAIFHSICAFCSAGFSPIINGMQVFSSSYFIPGIIMILVTLGGIGFPVVVECWQMISKKKQLSYYSKIVIFISLSLVFIGTILILISDWNESLKDLPYLSRIWNALFASITCRTSGYDTLSPAQFSTLGRIVMIILMVFGASPSSTGGGIKTTTVGVLAISVWNELHSRRETTFMHKTIPHITERRALALTVVYVMTFFIAAILLTFIEGLPFSDIIFESASAMGTVGLTTGITAKFSAAGKIIFVLLMFWGRVGILTFFASIVSRDKGPEVKYPDINILIG